MVTIPWRLAGPDASPYPIVFSAGYLASADEVTKWLPRSRSKCIRRSGFGSRIQSRRDSIAPGDLAQVDP
jgi:hypothetical protein